MWWDSLSLWYELKQGSREISDCSWLVDFLYIYAIVDRLILTVWMADQDEFSNIDMIYSNLQG